MPVSTSSTFTIMPAGQSSGGSLKDAATSLRTNGQNRADGDLWAQLAKALTSAQSQVDTITSLLRGQISLPDPIQITDPGGAVVAQIGHMLGSNNQNYSGIYARNIWIGGNGFPDLAPFSVESDGSVSITGAHIVLDGTNSTITLDPVLGEITIVGKGANTVNLTLTAQTFGGSTSIITIQDQANPTNHFAVMSYNRLSLEDLLSVFSATLTPSSLTIASATDTSTILPARIDTTAYSVGGVAGASGNLVLTPTTETTAVRGTPGSGQSNFTAITSYTLTTNVFTNGLRVL